MPSGKGKIDGYGITRDSRFGASWGVHEAGFPEAIWGCGGAAGTLGLYRARLNTKHPAGFAAGCFIR